MGTSQTDATAKSSVGGDHRQGVHINPTPRVFPIQGPHELPPPNASTRSSRTPSPYPDGDSVCDDDDDDEDDDEVTKAQKALLSEVYSDDWEARFAFFKASRIAPISKQSLSELDIGSIINNSKLRHDVNFDRELHFRPNMDGERGRKKRDTHNHYWKAISVELSIVFHVLQSTIIPDAKKPVLIMDCTARLRQMFEAIKEILTALVPERDQSDVDEHLDVDMVMQEISRGVCNFVSIAGWMAQLLKRHCAPMRDDMVDKMVLRIELQKPDSITAGLGGLFEVLEAMKLDVANHQIRHLRALLIEDTINFEKKYHLSRMKKHRYDCGAARRWYTRVRDSQEFKRIPMADSWPNRDVEAFVKAFMQLFLPTAAYIPDTFALDNDRIRQLRADFDDSIRESICCDVLNELLAKRGGTLSPTLQATFRRNLQIIAGDARITSWHLRAVDDIACEIVRFALQATGSTAEVDAELEEVALQMLTARLCALHQARYGGDLAPEHADDQDRIDKYGQTLFDRLSPRVFRCVEEHLSSSPYDIFLALVPPPCPPPLGSVAPTMRPTGREQELVRKMAHIAILHWRTWEDLVYNKEDPDRNAGGSNTENSKQVSKPGPETPGKKPVPTTLVPKTLTRVGTENTGEGAETAEALA